MSSKSNKKETDSKSTGRYIKVRQSGELVSGKKTDNSLVEQKIIQKILTFPPSKQQKILAYAEILEKEESARKTIWNTVKNIIEEIPKKDWDKLPTDGSVNVDHYLYGHKKKSK